MGEPIWDEEEISDFGHSPTDHDDDVEKSGGEEKRSWATRIIMDTVVAGLSRRGMRFRKKGMQILSCLN